MVLDLLLILQHLLVASLHSHWDVQVVLEVNSVMQEVICG